MSQNVDYRELIRLIKDKTGKNQAELAQLLGVSQPTISRWIKGNPPELEHAERITTLARSLRLIGRNLSASRTSVPIVGYVGAGGTISFRDGQGPFGEAEMPPKDARSSLAAVQVSGDSMSGVLEDGWMVYYDSRKEPPDEGLHAKLCIVGLTDGRVLIKRLYPGRKRGHFDLHSANAPPLFDQPVEWAAKVIWIECK